VKVTPAHDHTDFEVGQRHGLPLVDVMTDEAAMSEAAGPYAGLSRDEARHRVLADLEARGDLLEARPHEMVVGRCQRSDDIIEPRLKTQWFIDVRPMAQLAMRAVREGRTRIVPARFEKVFFDWLENIHDWNVSRRLWWGHRIPAWYCTDGHVTVTDGREDPSACPRCGGRELAQESDVLDTWFSSALFPFSTLGWPDRTPDLADFYPTSVMETAYDILFFWVARMMMLGEWLTGREPFSVVYLSGLVRDPYGRKMSKTTGNVIDPLGVMDEIGADALRFALVSGAAPGADQRLGRSRLEGARNFANKLWNAARFVLGSRPEELPADMTLGLPPPSELGPADHWILARSEAAVRDVEEAYATFQFAEATRLLHDALWSEYCDWYLELAKPHLGQGRPLSTRRATWQVLTWVLDRYLRLLHPVMPHITEEIWGRLPRRPDDPELLIVAAWPRPSEGAIADRTRASAVAAILELVTQIRNARTDAGIASGAWLDATVWLAEPLMREVFLELGDAVGRLARIRATVVDARDGLPPVQGRLAVVSRGAEARLSGSEADRERERARLRRELDETARLLAASEARLADQRFVSRAPEHVVGGVRARVEELRARLDGLRASLDDG
jgi:valyl-tRNA synthetase